MEQPVTAVYDANILYPAPLRDLFIRLAQADLVRAKWTEAIHEEWIRNVLKDNPRPSAEQLALPRSAQVSRARRGSPALWAGLPRSARLFRAPFCSS